MNNQDIKAFLNIRKLDLFGAILDIFTGATYYLTYDPNEDSFKWVNKKVRGIYHIIVERCTVKSRGVLLRLTESE